MIELPQGKIVGIFGPVASGKTELLKRFLMQRDRKVVFDSTGEFLNNPDYIPVFMSPKQLNELIKQTPWVYSIAYMPGPDLSTDFHYVLSTLWWRDESRLLAVDELHLLFPNNSGNPDAEMLNRFGRHAKIEFIGISQRIADVHKLFTSSCRMTILFWTQESRDLMAIQERWGDDVKNMVLSLRPLVYNDVTETVQTIPQCVVLEKGQAARIFDFQSDSYV